MFPIEKFTIGACDKKLTSIGIASTIRLERKEHSKNRIWRRRSLLPCWANQLECVSDRNFHPRISHRRCSSIPFHLPKSRSSPCLSFFLFKVDSHWQCLHPESWSLWSLDGRGRSWIHRVRRPFCVRPCRTVENSPPSSVWHERRAQSRFVLFPCCPPWCRRTPPDYPDGVNVQSKTCSISLKKKKKNKKWMKDEANLKAGLGFFFFFYELIESLRSLEDTCSYLHVFPALSQSIKSSEVWRR